jgi:hypothetical protein
MTSDSENPGNLSDHNDNDIDEGISQRSSSFGSIGNEDNQVDEPQMSELNEHFDDIVHVNDNANDNDELTKFIIQAREQRFNCLDLSKKNIEEIPPSLLAFPSLQVLDLSSIACIET